jgi:hypothetical protein
MGGEPKTTTAEEDGMTNPRGRNGNRLVAQGWVADKPCSITIDTGAAVTVIRPDIAAGLPEREPSTKCALQTASGETLPILKEAS